MAKQSNKKRIRTAPIYMFVRPEIKAAFKRAAEESNKSLTRWLEDAGRRELERGAGGP